MGLVKFYRGAAGVSLPEYQEGAIFIVERSSTTGDMYVDIEQGKRLHIVPDSPIKYVSKSWVNSHKKTIPGAGEVYVIADNESSTIIDQDGTEKSVDVPAIKVGDGAAYLADLPISYWVTQDRKEFWDNKVSVIEPSLNSEELIFTKN